MPKKPSKPHDEFFKAAFGRLDIALEYVQKMSPDEFKTPNLLKKKFKLLLKHYLAH